MPVQFENTELQTAEPLKSFETPDDLGKAYLDLHGKVSSGDVSIINEDLRKDPSMTFKNVNDLAKSYIETKKLVGSIKKPPEKPDGYKFTQLQNLHPGLKNVLETQKVLAAIFHEAGLHNESADIVQTKVLTLLSNGLQKSDEARQAHAKETETALRAEWKENYDRNKDTVEKVLSKAGAEDLAKTIGGNPVALKAMHKITALLSEDSIGKLGDIGPQNITDKGIALKRIQEMITYKEHLDKDGKVKTGPEYDKFMEEWKRLHELIGQP